MKKLILIVSVLISLIYTTSYANYERSDGNCNTANIEYFKNLLKYNSVFQNNKIVTKDVYIKALENLEKYCNNGKDTLSSPIFENHIIDIAFRKIDAIKGAAYGVKLDEKGLEYRQQLNELEKEYNTNPTKIAKLFKKYWGTAEQNLKANNNTLYGKYLLACKETSSLSDKLLTANSKNNKINSLFNGSLYSLCIALAEKRYHQETLVIDKISKQNYYNHINQNVYKKTNEEFTEKISNVFDKLMVMLGDFEYMVRRYIHATDVAAE